MNYSWFRILNAKSANGTAQNSRESSNRIAWPETIFWPWTISSLTEPPIILSRSDSQLSFIDYKLVDKDKRIIPQHTALKDDVIGSYLIMSDKVGVLKVQWW